MMDDPRTDPLREWNRLARENAENAIVASMFDAASLAREPLETFSTWLLVGTAAVASFLITNAEKVMPLIKQSGFSVCGAFLCLSCIFGVMSKMYALACKINSDVSSAVKKTFLEQLEKHEAEEKKIKEGAEFWGITLETGVRIERIITEFYTPFPKIVAWLASRQLKKYAENPQVNGILLIKTLNKQGMYGFLQSVTFLCFLISGFIFAAINH